METHVLGFPRIGANRELKRALERHWRGEADAAALAAAAGAVREANWRTQRDAGLSLVATGDFSLYDQVLDTVSMLGLVPERFGWSGGGVGLDTYFQMARGDSARNVPALEMTKWFGTNYHYLVPELAPGMVVRRASDQVLTETRQAVTLGFQAKPVLLGPITFLSLAREVEPLDRWALLEPILDVYCGILAELGPLCEWIQLDEPVLGLDMSPAARQAARVAWPRLAKAAGPARLMLANYFTKVGPNLELALTSGCAALHVDLSREEDMSLPEVVARLPESMVLSAGIVSGRNVWKTDLSAACARLRQLAEDLGDHRLMVASTCSLLHTPVDVACETELAPEIRDWLAFATQKCGEVAVLGRMLAGEDCSGELADNAAAIASRRNHPAVCRAEVRDRVASVTPDQLRRAPYAERRQAQADWLTLPVFPTTTIGSFPQTREIRAQRAAYARGDVTEAEYTAFVRRQIADTVARQEALGLDVLVHGEPERNDMVEYFGQQLDGFCFTRNGWVQSYGSRCVKPPIIYGDVSRPEAMTVPWITYAQSLTRKPMKGMLTGPVTILCWSFVRDDLTRADVCRQIALAIRDEVRDLEQAGVGIVQIDEAAFREGMPLVKGEQEGYLTWATECFRLASSGVAPRTQIHTHMCYSQFGAIVEWIARMDADVISIESSRSGMQLLDAFEAFAYPNEVGPGIYDIHSPRVPTVEELLDLLERALRVIPAERLWINPDCGLKTRTWEEVMPSLANLVEAARSLRQRHESDR
jgi:5-methyltetrahydropteroyltriglutamate--homocysteine methyltransferase